MKPTNGWRAFITDEDRLFRNARIVLYRERADGFVEVLSADGRTAHVVPEGVDLPEPAGWLVPRDALAALAEAFHPHAAHSTEVKRLEEALKIERQRVDDVLNRVVK